jgi:hypothetical protein
MPVHYEIVVLFPRRDTVSEYFDFLLYSFKIKLLKKEGNL